MKEKCLLVSPLFMGLIFYLVSSSLSLPCLLTGRRSPALSLSSVSLCIKVSLSLLSFFVSLSPCVLSVSISCLSLSPVSSVSIGVSLLSAALSQAETGAPPPSPSGGPLRIGVIQTAYANGGSTHFLQSLSDAVRQWKAPRVEVLKP